MLMLKLKPLPTKTFFVQCEQCPKAETVGVKATQIRKAISKISTEYLKEHYQHRVGVYSADGKQDETIDWASIPN